MTLWFAAGLVVSGAVFGVVCYIVWSSRDTHSEHSNYDEGTSVRAVRLRVAGAKLARRYGYAALAPAEPAPQAAERARYRKKN